ncbi:MAG: phospholipid/cholesterol/gamma-HCH transport system substrate-binding protein, partial [Thermoleophilaceae bacterium]|nr:phospholipid/cholesterol/gamma-HCH transport system substrate-binding protein [Thermoleophilaceae bacterium]
GAAVRRLGSGGWWLVQKTRPSFGRLALMGLFALSCFAILTFLWLSFGGGVPLASKRYEVRISFPEATTLAEQADVRISGVPVGKVQSKQLGDNLTEAVLRIDPRYAPLPADTRAVLRQKTLLGETYVELTPGTRNGPTIPDGHALPQGQVAKTVQLDEIFRAFDPKTRIAFRTWLQDQGRAFGGRSRDLNNALGNLTPFEQDTTTILQILDEQQGDVRRLVSNTGTVFNALTQRGTQLRSLIENSNRVFATTASRNQRLQEIFTILPTFLQESRATTTRVTAFAQNANPLITQLRPAARELSPTLLELRTLAPDLKGLFRDLGPLIDASRRGLPAVRRILDDTVPLLRQFDPFLRNVNPILDWLGMYKHEIAAFFALDAASTQAEQVSAGSQQPVHYLRTANPLNPENLGAYPHRISTNRSNPYVAPLGYNNHPLKVFGTYLCTNNAVPPLQPAGTLPGSIGQLPLPPGVVQPVETLLPAPLRDLIQTYAFGTGAAPPCAEQAPLGRRIGQGGKYPHVTEQSGG